MWGNIFSSFLLSSWWIVCFTSLYFKTHLLGAIQKVCHSQYRDIRTLFLPLSPLKKWQTLSWNEPTLFSNFKSHYMLRTYHLQGNLHKKVDEVMLLQLTKSLMRLLKQCFLKEWHHSFSLDPLLPMSSFWSTPYPLGEWYTF